MSRLKLKLNVYEDMYTCSIIKTGLTYTHNHKQMKFTEA